MINKEKKSNKWIILSAISLLFFFIVLYSVNNTNLFLGINKVINSNMIYYHTNFLTKLFTFYHYTFDTISLIIATAIISITLYLFNKKKEAIILASIMILDAVSIYSIKNFLPLARPLGGLVLETNGTFPSGHVTSSIVFIGLVTYISFEFFQKKWVSAEKLITFEMIALIIFIAYSRLYLSVHWFSDVIGGLFLGIFWLTIGIMWLEKKN